MILLAIREFANGFMSSQIGKAEPNGFGRSSEREYTMRDGEEDKEDQEQEGQAQKDQEQEEIDAHGNLRRLRALWKNVPASWKKIRKILKRPATNLGPTLIGLLLYGYASLIGFLYEQELVHLFDKDFNLSHYLTFIDFPFLAVKNTISFIVFIFGPPLICIIIAIIVILGSLILDILYFLVSKIHKSFEYVAGLERPRVEYANFREDISDDIDYSFKLKYYVVLLNAVILAIIKNIFISIFRIFIPWLLHRGTSLLARIGEFHFGIWKQVIGLLQIIIYPIRRIILIILFFIALSSPVWIVLSPTLVGYLPSQKQDFEEPFSEEQDLFEEPISEKQDLQKQWREVLRGWYKFNEGQVRTARPPKCFQKAKHISSTEKYAIFSLSETSANGAEKLLTVPVSNLASFQVGELGPCKSETDVADMKGDIAKIQLELEQSSKAGFRRDGEIKTLEDKVKDLEPIDGGLTQAVKKLQAEVNKNTEAGGKRDADLTLLKAEVSKNTEAGGKRDADINEIKGNVGKTQSVLDMNTKAGGDRDVAIDALWASVNTTWETVDENAEAGGKRDADLTLLKAEVSKNTEAGGKRDADINEIKGNVGKTQSVLDMNTKAGGDRDVAIDALWASVNTTWETVDENDEAGDRRDADLTLLKAEVSKNTEDGIGRNADIKEIKGNVDKTQSAVDMNTKAGGDRDVAIDALWASVNTTWETVDENAETGGRRDADLTLLKAEVSKNTEDGIGRNADIKAIKGNVGKTQSVLDMNVKADGDRDKAINALWASVNTTWESVNKNTEAGGRRDADLKSLKAEVSKNTEDGIGRNADIKAIKGNVGKTQSVLDMNVKADGDRDKAINALWASVNTTWETVDENDDAGGRRDADLALLKAEVRKNAEDGGKRDNEIKIIKESLKVNHEEAKKMMNGLLARLPGVPVSRFVTHVETGSKTESVIRYLLAGFPLLQSSLNQNQLDWLGDFHKALMSCAKLFPRPSIRLSGFASSEVLPKELGGEYQNLCKFDRKNPPPSSNINSDINNCRLANLRVARVAAFFESKLPKNGKDFNMILEQMDRHCEKGEKIELSPELSHIKIKPWCKVGDMKKERFKMAKLPLDDTEGQPHFLNRSVHIIFEKLGKCAEANF